jgi:S1-C subfamily serine protease/thiol-disulfide isomerase/thioredoxin
MSFKLLYAVSLLLTCTTLLTAQGIIFEKGNWADVLKKAKTENKNVFVHATAEWCGPCNWMAKNVFTVAAVASHFNSSFVNYKFDMEKGEGPEFAKKFVVSAYPTLLFFNPAGELVHKVLGAQQVDQLIAQSEKAMNPEKQVYTLKKKFEAGEKSEAFLKNYINSLLDANEDTKEASELYFNAIPKEDWTSMDNFVLIYKTQASLDSKMFNYVLANRALYEKSVGKEYVAYLINEVYYKEISRVAEEKDQKGADKLKLNIKKNLGSNAETMIAFLDFNYYMGTENELKYAQIYFDKYCDNANMLNQIAWQYFETETDKTKLKAALKWAEKSIELQKTSENLDTKAKLLDKLDKKEESMSISEEAKNLAIAEKEAKLVEEANIIISDYLCNCFSEFSNNLDSKTIDFLNKIYYLQNNEKIKFLGNLTDDFLVQISDNVKNILDNKRKDYDDCKLKLSRDIDNKYKNIFNANYSESKSIIQIASMAGVQLKCEKEFTLLIIITEGLPNIYQAIQDEKFSRQNKNISSKNLSPTLPSISTNPIEDCDVINYVPKSNKPSFENFLVGVKYAIIVNRPKLNGHIPAFEALEEYLKEMGFEKIVYSDMNLKQPRNLCEEIFVEINFSYDLEKFYDINITFANLAIGYMWKFTTIKVANAGPYSDPKYNFGQALRNMYGFKKRNFNSNFTLQLSKKQTCWNEDKLKSVFLSNGCDLIEGIYESTSNSENMAKYKVALKKIKKTYYLIYLSGAHNDGNWSEGEIKAALEPTATPLLYKATWTMADKTENEDYYITFQNGFFNLLSDNNEKKIFIKMFPTVEDISNNSSKRTGSGTGFALSSNGIIVTNHHVTEGATSIKVRGINGDFSKAYTAKVIIEDSKNDLSILKIEDSNFSTLGLIPYIISNRTIDVGTPIFVLGYPMRTSMGDEVKLTNGIISSKSGYKGDITLYQITAPIQPGNSGGPLFDDKGSIVGIVNAKHTGAENASYAIKVSYLMNLIELMPTPPKLQTTSSVFGKPLTEQVKILKNFTYIIETIN